MAYGPLNAMVRLLVVVLLALPAPAAARAKLTHAQWDPAAELPPNSELSEENRELTTRFTDPTSPLVAHGTLTYDITRGRDGILQFLSSHSWMKCEAPEGLEVGDSGEVAFVCRPEPDKLARIKKKTRITIKADPPGGGRHKKVYWTLIPEK